MPIKKIDKKVVDDPSKIIVKDDDLYVVAGYETGQTIMAEMDGEPVEVIGTIKDPLTTEELTSVGINIQEAIVAGILGKIANGQVIYYAADSAYSDYEEEPDHMKGNFIRDGQLDYNKRLAVGETMPPPTLNPSAFTTAPVAHEDDVNWTDED